MSIKHMEEYVGIFKANNENPDEIPILLIGGKQDLKANRMVTNKDAVKLFKQHKFTDYFECSSKTGENVNKIFVTLAYKLLVKEGVISDKLV